MLLILRCYSISGCLIDYLLPSLGQDYFQVGDTYSNTCVYVLLHWEIYGITPLNMVSYKFYFPGNIFYYFEVQEIEKLTRRRK